MLDSGPLGLITNPKLSPESVACAQWLQTHIDLNFSSLDRLGAITVSK